ncbi:Uncharacterized protein APZ42_022832 [Daphnia magna]|uniref:Uncharacterized protein n=1 Tax=Daphnia magna TaxID=35525 RepID=A0A164VV81_9CRUS|nr:Uncharacterized protein APZ42_022832 [Daphnia magna]
MVVGGSMSVTIPGKALVAAAQAHVLGTRRSHEQLVIFAVMSAVSFCLASTEDGSQNGRF